MAPAQREHSPRRTNLETDIEEQLKQLTKAGIAPRSVTRGEKVSVVIITDLDGNQVVFAQGKDHAHRATI
ncbi:hypothetical protein [Bradyrhizobium sp. S3.5.5]|uniref:hypothetical protein n=1 Tax=Bradyrhizobium sp. S3.5.5 TaxID=3156430 RepID=UPI0033951739